jgi:hypothetical protein
MPVTEKKLRSRDVTEHRWGQRIALEVPVKLEFGGRPMGHGLLRSASISGGFIDTTLELAGEQRGGAQRRTPGWLPAAPRTGGTRRGMARHGLPGHRQPARKGLRTQHRGPA